MRITLNGDVMNVSDIDELATATVNSFRSKLGALPSGVRRIDIDLSGTGFVDCSGLGALIALWKTAGGRNGAIRIRVLNPPQMVQRMWTLMRMDRVFPIDGEPARTASSTRP
jgi:anti-anti-sigma factor